MFYINTYLKSSGMWGTYLCNIFYEGCDVTERFKGDFEYKDNMLQISFWSWTWFNRIKQSIIDIGWIRKDVRFINVSLDI